MLADITKLSSDEFQGRAPGGESERLTVEYLTQQFKAAGLEPGNPDGTYVQNVRLVGLRPMVTSPFTVKQGGKSKQLRVLGDLVPFSTRVPEEVSLTDSEMVFVGYGIQSPEFNWDDYKGVDVKGKTILMLVNDPPIPGNGPDGLDPAVFGGKAMTYYGGWVYKYAKAAEMGAAGVLVRIEEIYRAADCYVFPTFCAEGAIELPLSVLEALASGLPVVTTRFHGAADAIVSEDGGRVVEDPADVNDLAESIAHYFDEGIRTKARTVTRQWMEQVPPGYNMEQTLRVYDEVVRAGERERAVRARVR